MTDLKDEMIYHLIKNNDIVFKSQQIGEPDLTQEEKRIIAEACLLEKPGTFLSRFGKYLLEHHLNYFSTCENNSYEVEYYLCELKKRSSTRSATTVRNRRLEALKRLAIEGEYFTENEMKKRDPLLYDQLVGKFLTADEKKEKEAFTCTSGEELKLSGLLLEQIERDIVKDLKTRQEQAEDDAMEEEDTDEEEADPDDDRVMDLWGEEKSCRNKIVCEDRKTEEEKKLLFEEFRWHMYMRFLSGNEQDFNYSEVDLNMDYDDLDQVERDEQEKYFEDDGSEDMSDVVEIISDSAKALRIDPESVPVENSFQPTTVPEEEIY